MMNPLREPSAFSPNYWAERAAVLRSAVNNANPDIDPVLLEIALEGAEDVLQMEVELADQPLVGWTYNDNEISDLVAARSAAQALAILHASFPDHTYYPECLEQVDENGFRNRTWCFDETPDVKLPWSEFIKRITIPRHLTGVYF
ncbi:hypothetical protein ACR3H8_27680 [Pseudomonas aeruginosa]|jgi:hypothetical protein|uniref:Uncharacterized protein n=4 Tax=Pseudomonas TaxID=286 RepID=A0A1V0M6J2_PSEAI|nr:MULTISPECIES: hypothetical protein [Pseudomonas]MDU7557838.1 hypothetical protein [Pseudomonas sp.]WQN30335.1 hypothetical protein ULE26_22455 [Stutzerimonas stutzeri]AGL46397.1 hypothetical protein pOZ176_439 [Pseudomonas aeruginosa PA96]ARD70513.1 Hypothetical protein [Pseudomonas aeruginosa]ASU52391.1 Hypothetical protein [Pseudomonas putida]